MLLLPAGRWSAAVVSRSLGGHYCRNEGVTQLQQNFHARRSVHGITAPSRSAHRGSLLSYLQWDYMVSDIVSDLLSCNFQTTGKDWTWQPILPSLIRDHPHLRFFTLWMTLTCVINRVIIIIIIMWPATKVNSAWPSLRWSAQWVPAKGQWRLAAGE